VSQGEPQLRLFPVASRTRLILGGAAVHRCDKLVLPKPIGLTAERVCLELLPKEFKKHIADERGDHGNFKIGSGKNISDGPS
jgi:hypothetical protein